MSHVRHNRGGRSAAAVWALALAAMAGAGCRSVGPATVARDRYAYSNAISESWKRQTLLNIVKLRYVDPPIFVDVGQIIAAYSLESSMNIGGSFSSITGDSSSIGGNATFTDRPTVTYTPLTGNKFITSLMQPLSAEALLLAIQSGWNAEVIFTLSVIGINGIHNASIGIGGYEPADPRFARVGELLAAIQASGAVRISLQRDESGGTLTIISFHSPRMTGTTAAQISELRLLLGLNQDATQFEVVPGDAALNDRQIAMRTRSLLHTITALSMRVDVPQTDIAEGRAFGAPTALEPGQFRILHATASPDDAFAAVEYRGRWFYIDDRDLVSKRTFGIIMLLFTLADSGTQAGAPVLTIPAN